MKTIITPVIKNLTDMFVCCQKYNDGIEKDVREDASVCVNCKNNQVSKCGDAEFAQF